MAINITTVPLCALKSPRKWPVSYLATLGDTDLIPVTLRAMETKGLSQGHTACPQHNQSQSQDPTPPTLPSLPGPLSVAHGVERVPLAFQFLLFGGRVDAQNSAGWREHDSMRESAGLGVRQTAFQVPAPWPWAGRIPFPAQQMGSLGQHLAPEGQGAQGHPSVEINTETRAQKQRVRGNLRTP